MGDILDMLDLLISITKKATYIEDYADDVAIQIMGKFTETVVGIMNQRLKEVYACCRAIFHEEE